MFANMINSGKTYPMAACYSITFNRYLWTKMFRDTDSLEGSIHAVGFSPDSSTLVLVGNALTSEKETIIYFLDPMTGAQVKPAY
jgi:hypothetical protein